jgi:hypothetical protein
MRKHVFLLSVILISVPAWAAGPGEECTTAVISGGATTDSRPILWKNRDTDKLSNKVVFVDEKPFSYLGVTDAADTSGRAVWGGLNSAGFAIINSVAYNLPKKSGEMEDLEGMVMADALRKCATVDDFEQYIKTNLGPDLGSRTNFCVIDAQGGAAIFEVHNHGYKKLDATEPPDKYMLNTNFSRSGPENEGAGYLRFDRETQLFTAVPAGTLTCRFVLQDVARDLGHVLVVNPGRADWKSLSASRPYWLHSNYTINRGSTASSILIHGVKKGEDPRRATLWVILGEPVCSIAVPLWVEAGTTPPEMHEGQEAPIAKEASRLKGILRPLKGRDREEYLDLSKLDNAAGTGWLPSNMRMEDEVFQRTEALLSRNPTAVEVGAFEKEMASRVLARLREIR